MISHPQKTKKLKSKLKKKNASEFIWNERSAKKVKLAGDFNNWVPEEMERISDNDWRLVKDLSEGEYDYKFVVDEQWCLNSSSEVVDRKGNKNHVMRVEPTKEDEDYIQMKKKTRKRKMTKKKKIIIFFIFI